MTIDELEQHIFMAYPPGSAQRQWIEWIRSDRDIEQEIQNAWSNGYDEGYSESQSHCECHDD